MRVNRRSLTLFLVVALLLTSVAVVSAQGGEGLPATVRNFLFVRVVPDINANDYGRLEPGTEVQLIGRTSDGAWVKLVTSDGTVGWGRTDGLDFEGDVSDLPDMSLGATQGVVVAFANLREAPDINARSSVRLTAGTVVTVSATDGEWVYVQAEDGSSGWVLPRALAFMGGEMPDVPMVNAAVQGFANLRAVPAYDARGIGRLDPGTPVNIVGRSSDGEWVQVETLDGTVGWGTALAFAYEGDLEELPDTTPAESQAAVTNFAVLRAGPSAEAAELGRLEQGTVVDLLMVDGDRVFVSDGEHSGWVPVSALSYPGGVMPEVLAANATVTTTANVETVNLRAAPGADAQRRGWAAVGERLAVVGVSEDGQWYRVVPTSHVGAWIFADLVTLDEGVGPLPVLDAEGNPVS